MKISTARTPRKRPAPNRSPKRLEESLAQIGEFRARAEETERELSECESSIAALREEHMRASAAKNEIDVRSASLKSKLDYISERILNDYETAISAADWKRELWKADEEFETKIKLDELEDGEVSAKPKARRGEPAKRIWRRWIRPISPPSKAKSANCASA